jgi:peptidoglycan/LPS O-acetylase OafA/YrhL
VNLAKNSSLAYRPDIDGLRAIAVLLVVVFHFNLIPGGKSGFLGVDVFFVISGFLITAIISTQIEQGTFSFASFYLHRVRRLAPALFAVLTLVMIAGSIFLYPTELVNLSKQALVSQFYFANIYYWQSINYFGLNASNIFLLHTWSLAVEEQFYLAYPLGIFLLYRYARLYLWSVLALGFVVSFSLNLWMVEAKPEATFYLLPTRAWELIVGSLAFYASTNMTRSKALNELLAICGFGLVFLSVVKFHDGLPFPGTFALLPTLGAACLLVSGSGDRTTLTRVLTLLPLVYIGRISYTLYLVHWPVNVFAKRLYVDGYTAPMRTLMLLFSTLLSILIFHFIENPIRTGRFLSSARAVAKIYFLGLMGTLVVVSVIIFAKGLPQRFPDEAIRLANYVNDRTDSMPECEFQGKPLVHASHFCAIGDIGKKPSWIVFGDSHAWAGHGAFSKWLETQGQAGLFMFRNSCPPIFGVHLYKDHGVCNAFNDAVGAFIESNSSIRNVLLVSTWRQPIEARLSTSPNLRLPREESIRLFEARFSESLQRLHRHGKRIYIWEPVPGAKRNVPQGLADALSTNDLSGIEIQKEEYFSEFDFFFQSIEKNRNFITQRFSPSTALCGTGRCQVTVNGNPLYYDNAHVSKSSADFWSDMLTRQHAR